MTLREKVEDIMLDMEFREDTAANAATRVFQVIADETEKYAKTWRACNWRYLLGWLRRQ